MFNLFGDLLFYSLSSFSGSRTADPSSSYGLFAVYCISSTEMVALFSNSDEVGLPPPNLMPVVAPAIRAANGLFPNNDAICSLPDEQVHLHLTAPHLTPALRRANTFDTLCRASVVHAMVAQSR